MKSNFSMCLIIDRKESYLLVQNVIHKGYKSNN